LLNSRDPGTHAFRATLRAFIDLFGPLTTEDHMENDGAKDNFPGKTHLIDPDRGGGRIREKVL
jgi:hypothetical protein